MSFILAQGKSGDGEREMRQGEEGGGLEKERGPSEANAMRAGDEHDKAVP
jgi:hypothetical protein